MVSDGGDEGMSWVGDRLWLFGGVEASEEVGESSVSMARGLTVGVGVRCLCISRRLSEFGLMLSVRWLEFGGMRVSFGVVQRIGGVSGIFLVPWSLMCVSLSSSGISDSQMVQK